MKIALLSDIHGNSIALDAVLADIRGRGGVDGYWVLGDLAALGHDPVGVLERLAALPAVRIVRGNTDRYVCTGDRPPPSLADVATKPEALPALVEMAGTFAWTQGAITAAGWLPWMQELPLEMWLDLPDGTRFLGVHASPGRDDGDGFNPDMSDAEIESRLQGCQADLVCAGHTHRWLDRRIGAQRVINPGSLSNPLAAEWRASYVWMEATESGYELEHCLVEYDREAVVRAVEQLNHPGGRYIVRHMRGMR